MKPLRFGNRSIGLLVVLLAVIASVSFAEARTGSWLIFLMSSVMLSLGGVYVLAASRRWLTVYCTAAVLMIVLGALANRTGHMALAVAATLASMAVAGLLLAAVLKYSLLPEGVERLDRVVSGLCGYLLIGIGWASVLELIDLVVPNSFLDPNGGDMGGSDFLYLSLTTLTTLGYGDIQPASNPARMFSVLEAIFGTLYVAVFIASLISHRGPRDGTLVKG